MWKTVLMIIGIIIMVIAIVFLYLLIAGADESRKRNNTKTDRVGRET